MRRREFISRERIEADIARPFTAAARCPSLCARPWRRMILDPRLGAHVLCFELSDERSETRWERCRECVRPVRHEAALAFAFDVWPGDIHDLSYALGEPIVL